MKLAWNCRFNVADGQFVRNYNNNNVRKGLKLFGRIVHATYKKKEKKTEWKKKKKKGRYRCYQKYGIEKWKMRKGESLTNEVVSSTIDQPLDGRCSALIISVHPILQVGCNLFFLFSIFSRTLYPSKVCSHRPRKRFPNERKRKKITKKRIKITMVILLRTRKQRGIQFEKGDE